MSEQQVNFDGAIDSYIKNKNSEDPHTRRVGVYYASELGHQCPRNLFLKYKFPNKKYSERTLRIFKLGDLIHGFIQKAFLNEHEIFSVDEIERRVTAKFEAGPRKYHYSIHGRVDAVIVKQIGDFAEPFAVEIKSCSPNMFKYAGLPKEEHKIQLTFYLKQLGLPRGYILYVEKYGLQMKPFLVEFDPELYDEIIEKTRRLHYSLVKNKIPEKHASFPDKYPCSYCNFKEECQKENAANK